MGIIHKVFNYFSQNSLISAEIMKKRGKSHNSPNSAFFSKKMVISADNLIFIRKSRISTKSQRKCDYFREKNPNIVCHDSRIRSIFRIFKIRFDFTWKRGNSHSGGKIGVKMTKIRILCSQISVISLRSCARNLFKDDYKLIPGIIGSHRKKGGKNPDETLAIWARIAEKNARKDK